MKAINTTRMFKLEYPKETPRISRKRLWMDRSEWRQQPGSVYKGSSDLIDQRAEVARNTPELSQTTQDFPDLYDRAGRIGLKKL